MVLVFAKGEIEVQGVINVKLVTREFIAIFATIHIIWGQNGVYAKVLNSNFVKAAITNSMQTHAN